MEAGLLSEMVRDGQREMGVTVKEFIGPLRHALTGERVRENQTMVQNLLMPVSDRTEYGRGHVGSG